MKTKYNKLALTHNLSGVIIPTDRYKHIYSKRAYSISPVIALYDDKIDRYAMRTEVQHAEGKQDAKRNDHALYKTTDTVCKTIITEVVDKTWYKDLEDPDTFYTNVTALKLLDHITKFCSEIHTANAVDITKLMKTLFTDADGILQFVNAMETAQKKSRRAKLVIQDKYIHTVALKLLLK